MNKIMDRFWCGFCLNSFESEDYPSRCTICHFVCCGNCGTFLKGDSPEFCIGCGRIRPSTQARMYRSSSTAGAIWLHSGFPNMMTWKNEDRFELWVDSEGHSIMKVIKKTNESIFVRRCTAEEESAIATLEMEIGMMDLYE